MKMQLEQIVHNLFHTSSLEHVPSERLEELVKRYPYFSIGHLLLARKLQLEDKDLFEPQVQKTALYFHDPLWLHWQLDHANKENGFAEETVLVDNVEIAKAEFHSAEISGGENSEREKFEAENFRTENFQSETVEAETIEPEISQSQSFEAEPGEVETTEDETVEAETFDAENTQGETYQAGSFTESGVEPDRQEEDISITKPAISGSTEEAISEEAVVEESSFHTTGDFSEETNAVNSGIEEPATLINGGVKEEQSFHETESSASDSYQNSPDQSVISGEVEERPASIVEAEKEQEPIAEEAEQDPDDTEQIHSDLSSDPSSELSEAKTQPFQTDTRKLFQTPLNDKAPLAFDAYYTIDYFASQGIKAPAEVQPGDKLGKQLKSFTEWLKTMKRLPQTQPESQTDEREQQHIRQFADGSLVQKEVVTETMAEVLVKQDKKEEAIAIYEKLSLLDPSKSGYFAAKIENLKVN